MDVIDLYLIGFIYGYPINGTVINGATITLGQHDGALETNGLNQLVDFGDHSTECFHRPDMCSTGVTYAVWLRRMGVGFEVFLDTGGLYKYSIGYAMFQNTYNYIEMVVTNQMHYYRAVSMIEWRINHWDHFVWTWNTIEGITVYINGCRLSSEMVTYYVTSRSHTIITYETFTVGGGSRRDGYNSRMRIDDLFIWHSVFTEKQVWQLYVNGGRWWLNLWWWQRPRTISAYF